MLEGRGRSPDEKQEDKKMADWCLEILTSKSKMIEWLREETIAIFKCIKLSPERKGMNYSQYWDRANGSVLKLQLTIKERVIVLPGKAERFV